MTKQIELTQGKIALVDDADYKWLMQWKWSACTNTVSRTWYVVRREQHKTIAMHRQIMECPEGKVVDHINGNGWDNRRCNLRVCTHKQNNCNSRLYSNNTSGYKGVYLNSSTGRYVARISPDKQHISLGKFRTPEQAAVVYNMAAVTFFGEFASLNTVKLSGNECEELRDVLARRSRGLNINNKSGYRGVSFDKSRNKWHAEITVDWKKIHLGRFDTPEQAALAYNKAAIEQRGELARLNNT